MIINEHFHKKNTFEGPILRLKPNGSTVYRVEISQTVHMDNDPSYPCRTYSAPGEYHQCLEHDFVGQSLEMMNCTPPWLTSNKSLWCQDQLQLQQDVYDKFGFLVRELSFGDAISKNCPVPCLTSDYQVNPIGVLQNTAGEGSGLMIKLDHNVKRTVSKPQIEFLALLSRFGGIIGLGKNLLWIVILMFTAMNLFARKN